MELVDISCYKIIRSVTDAWEINIKYNNELYVCIFKKDNFVSDIINFDSIDTFLKPIFTGLKNDVEQTDETTDQLIKDVEFKENLQMIVHIESGKKPQIVRKETIIFHFNKVLGECIENKKKH